MDAKLLYRRTGLIVVETLAVITVFIVIAVSVASWRLLSGPLDLDFAKPYIQEALRDSDTGVYVTMDKVVLQWPALNGPLLLGLQGAAVYGPGGRQIASIDEAALGLHKGQLFLGRIRPEALILKRPSLSVIRNKDNSFDVGVADFETYGPQPQDDNEETQSDFIEQILGFVAADDEEHAPGVLSKLKSFEVEDARLLIEDRVLDLSWVLPRSDALVERLPEGLKATLLVDLPSEEEQKPHVKLEALIDPQTRQAALNVLLERFDVALLAEKIPELSVLAKQDVRLDAQLQASLTSDLQVSSARLTLLSDAGTLDIPEWSAVPVGYRDFGVLAEYDGTTRKLGLSKAQISVGDVDLGASADLTLGEHDIKGPVRLEIEQLAQKDIAPLWPVALAEDNAKEWIVDKLGDGTFSDVYGQGEVEAVHGENGWAVDLAKVVAGFAFEGMSVNYRAPLKPVTNAKGKGEFRLASETLRIDIESAKLLDLDITKADVELVNIIEAGKGQADINVKLNGPAKSVLTYVKDEPIGVNTAIDIAKAKGHADLSVNISLPTKKDVKVADVKVTAKGTLTDMDLPNVVHGQSISGGPYTLKIEKNLLNVKGKGQISNRPIDLDFSQYLVSAGAPYSMKAKALLTADPNLRNAFGIDLSTFLEGPAGVDVVYTEFTDGRAEADVKADLTQSRLFLDPFDYVKAPGAAAEASLKAYMVNSELKEIRNLTGTAPKLSLETTTLGFRQHGDETQLSSGTVSRFTLNETVAKLEFERAVNGRTKIVLDGPFLDLRPFLNNEDEDKDKPYTAPPLEISVAVDRMRTADEQTVQYGKLYADIDGEGKFNQLEMDAIAGKGDVYLRYKPDGSGKRVFRLEADDAGATLKAFSVYDKIVGGKLMIYGEPIRGVFDRNLIGVAEITDFKVVKAPVLAQLLSVMSLSGLIQNLGGEGLSFSKMEANFDWLYRPKGSVLVLKDGRTSGNSLGLTFDGTFDNAAHKLDVAGTIIPLSGMNKIISDIPLVGDILTGGTGALIAATYKITGSSDDPKVSVNPLSVLTPGILRRILFEQN